MRFISAGRHHRSRPPALPTILPPSSERPRGGVVADGRYRMIVYRDQRSRDDPRHAFSEVRRLTRRYPSEAPSHDTARDALIASGRLEAAVADTLFPESDGVHPLVEAFRAATETAGHLLWHTWHQNARGAGAWWLRLARQLDSIDVRSLPAEV